MPEKSPRPIRELVDRLNAELPSSLRKVDIMSFRTPGTKDRQILESTLIDAMGIVRDSMELTEPQNASMIRLQTQRIRLQLLTADIKDAQGPDYPIAGNKVFDEFMTTLTEDLADFKKSGMPHLRSAIGEIVPIPGDFKDALDPLRQLHRLVGEGRIKELDKPYLNDLVKTGICLNDWKTHETLGDEKAGEYVTRMRIAVEVMGRTIENFGNRQNTV